MDAAILPVELKGLERGHLRLMRIEAGMAALVLVIALFVLRLTLWPYLVEEGVARPWMQLVAVPALAIALWQLTLAPARRFAAWGYALAADELHVAHGVWTQVHTIVPLTRVQHIDIAQGPIERLCGIVRLVVHTAGTEHAVVELPGITRAAAEAMRDSIRAHVRAEPW